MSLFAVGLPAPRLLLLAVLLIGFGRVWSHNLATQYLLVSSPSTGNIYYVRLPSLHTQSLPIEDRYPEPGHLLIDGETRCVGYGCREDDDVGLKSPHGLAVHEGESLSQATLFVSDPEALSIYAYTLMRSQFGGLTATGQHKILQNVDTKALAVDAFGNLFYTVTESGEVNMLTTDYLAKAAEAWATGSTLPEPEVVALYGASSKGEAGAAVARPAGIASDNFFVYWANQGGDEATGTVVKAPDSIGEDPAQFADALQALAANSDSVNFEDVASNVCLARDTAFFTGDTHSLWAVKTSGSLIAEVAKNFSKPKGCVYDRQGSLYVADEADGVVYSLAANFNALRAVRYTTRTAVVPGADQIAIFGAGTPQNFGVRAAPSAGSFAAVLVLLAAAAQPR